MKRLDNNILVYVFLALVFVSGVTACSDADFEKSPDLTKNNGFDIPEEDINNIPDIYDPECANEQVCLVIRDNFERPALSGSEFYWSQFLDDKGRSLNGLDIKIRNEAPASSGTNSLYFTGRPGGSVHSLYLTSKEFDLRGFTRVTVEFDYVLASFESFNDTFNNNESGDEFLRVDLCTQGPQNCGIGVNQSVAAQRLQDDNRWLQLYGDFATQPINQHLNGLNHSAADYVRVRGGQVTFDLNNPAINPAKVMIRWNVKLTDGLDSPEPEAGIVDNIVVRAYRY